MTSASPHAYFNDGAHTSGFRAGRQRRRTPDTRHPTEMRRRFAARYGFGDPLLSGWVLGGEHIAGQPAILEADIGQGSVVLFGFQPNYRAQTMATWPLLFNAIR